MREDGGGGRDEMQGAQGCIHHVVWCRSHLYLLFFIICFLRACSGRGDGKRQSYSSHLFLH